MSLLPQHLEFMQLDYSVLLLQLWHLKLLEETQLLLHVCSSLGVVLV